MPGKLESVDFTRRPKNWSPEAHIDLMEFLGRRKHLSQDRPERPFSEVLQETVSASQVAAAPVAKPVEQPVSTVVPVAPVEPVHEPAAPTDDGMEF